MPALPGDLPIDSALVGGTELAQRLNRILPDVGKNSVDFSNHLAALNPHPQYLTASSNTAALTAFAPTGNIGSANVQGAIVELDNEKMPYAGGVFQGSIGIRNQVVGDGTWTTNGWLKGAALPMAASIWWPKGTSAYSKGIAATNDNNIYFIRSTDDQGQAGDSPFTFAMDTGNLTMLGNVLVGAAQSNAVNSLTRKDYVDSKVAVAAGGVGSSKVLTTGFGANAVYTNTYGKPIFVYCTLHPHTSYGVRSSLYVQGNLIQTTSCNSNVECGLGCIVPPGWTFQVTLGGSQATLNTYGIVY
jgi:hypothetical protein